MAVTDPIADYLTRIRNAQMVGHKVVEIPMSKMKKRITEILYDQGYIFRYKFEADKGVGGTISIALRYDQDTKAPAITKLGRVSCPSLRKYVGVDEIPRIINDLGIAIMSTPKGVITNKEARQLNVGGEVLLYIY